MDLFKSVFADDPPPSDSDESQRQDQQEEEDGDSAPESNPSNSLANPNEAWSFGGLIKTLATKSESVIQNYRLDLEDFGSGLRKETSAIRAVAALAVKDFPSSLDAGASVAQESLESVGQAIDSISNTVWKSTAGIIAHGKDTLLASERDSDPSNGVNNSNENDDNGRQQLRSSSSSRKSLNLKPYSRFEAQLRTLQSNKDAYLEEPEDSNSYKEWKLEFELGNREEEIEDSMKENEVMRKIYEEVVPEKIERESFWCRYFYRVHKLKEAEETRAKLVKRAISGEDDEDLSWDFDDEEGGGGEGGDDKQEHKRSGSASKGESSGGNAEKQSDTDSVGNGESASESKDSDVSIVSRPEEGEEDEDLGWDEIEDFGSSDESRGVAGASVGSSMKAAHQDRPTED